MTGVLFSTYLDMFSKRRGEMKKVTDYYVCENELCENPY